ESVDSDAFVSNPNTIGVAAVSSLGFKSFYSDFGDGVWVSAPSDGALGIVTSDVRGDYGDNGTGAGELDPSGDTTDTFSGTSAAAPAVSGLLGLIYSANPELTAAQAKDILRRTSRKIDQVNGLYTEDADGFLWSPYYGYGLVDAHAAVRAAVLGCSPESLEVCIPAVTCADGPQLGIPEVCNGVDDDCDGDTDEEVCPADPIGCEPCNLAGTCDGGCTYLADDLGPSCLAPCSEDSACDEGFGCDSGFCIPDSGRCSEPSEELCDGRDNDADGLIDEEACEPGDGESCEFDGQCPTGFVCQYERCFQTCEDVADCANNDACLALADGYGQALDTSVCAPEFDFDFSCEEGCLFLYQNAPGPLFDALLGCVMDATTCDEASGCIPN
ncbi:MAG: S8 family serine peptidase, partial [Myxococcota bacterium]|nr:S8 family serine peptidase [Myxococcota bacterium]